ncbi:hypothetical protein D4R75_06120 [bacterium]|nr:MAG: hypothetical protein D4R75_06120 [bacterium]
MRHIETHTLCISSLWNFSGNFPVAFSASVIIRSARLSLEMAVPSLAGREQPMNAVRQTPFFAQEILFRMV